MPVQNVLFYGENLLITMGAITRGMTEAINRSGRSTSGGTPKVQAVTVEELLAGHKPDLATAILPYVKAQGLRRRAALLGDLKRTQWSPRPGLEGPKLLGRIRSPNA